MIRRWLKKIHYWYVEGLIGRYGYDYTKQFLVRDIPIGLRIKRKFLRYLQSRPLVYIDGLTNAITEAANKRGVSCSVTWDFTLPDRPKILLRLPDEHGASTTLQYTVLRNVPVRSIHQSQLAVADYNVYEIDVCLYGYLLPARVEGWDVERFRWVGYDIYKQWLRENLTARGYVAHQQQRGYVGGYRWSIVGDASRYFTEEGYVIK